MANLESISQQEPEAPIRGSWGPGRSPELQEKMAIIESVSNEKSEAPIPGSWVPGTNPELQQKMTTLESISAEETASFHQGLNRHWRVLWGEN